jgi:hypothetical protein
MSKLWEKTKPLLEKLIENERAEAFGNELIKREKQRLRARLVKAFKRMDAEDRARVLEATNDPEDMLLRQGLFSYAYAMSQLAVEESSVDHIRDGLIAIVIENYRENSWDCLTHLHHLCDSARKLGVDEVALLQEACAYATPKMAEVLNEFAERSPDLRGIEFT